MQPALLLEALDQAIGALDDAGLPYALVGGLAVSAWGVVRATQDIDLYAPLSSPDDRGRLLSALVKRGFHVPAMEGDLSRFGVFRSSFGQGLFLDIFDAAGPLGEAILQRRQSLELQCRRLWLIAPEELVALKAFSDRPRDHEDLVQIIGVLGDRLDRARVLDWARRLDESLGTGEVTERLRRAGLDPR